MSMAPKSSNPCCCKTPLKKAENGYDYDLVVIGEGHGGLAAAKEAAHLGAKVALIDCNIASQDGHNYECVIEKLMHQAAYLGELVRDSRYYGWKFQEHVTHQWKDLTNAIQNQIKSLKSSVKAELRDKNIDYIHGQGSFKDPHTIQITGQSCKRDPLTGKYALIAVGSKPRYPNIPGAQEYGITSDDVVFLENSPGKSLVMGSGRAAIECAGFLWGLSCDVTIMNRTTVEIEELDQQMVGMVLNEMTIRGVRFLDNCHATSITRSSGSSGKLNICWNNKQKERVLEDFDTIIFAIGRKALTKDLHLELAGVQGDEGKIDASNEQTSVSHIYALGDVLYNKPQCRGAAIKAGVLLSRRLFAGSKINMDYELVGTTLHAPIEYGAIGLSEETAISRYGEDFIEIYHAYYCPSEFFLPGRRPENCYMKVVGLRETTRDILGMHFMGPNAGEVMQGFISALKCRLTLDGLLNTVGVHTTNAEEFTKLTVTKRSGLNPHPTACCS